ncbi:aminotransferase class I/II-fold pyridoxal phosphate-dependent enzyme, partial [Fusobacterium sp.]
FALMSHGLTKFGVEVSFVDTSDLEAVKKAMKANTRVIYLETPANPNLKIVDIEEVSKIAHTNPNTLVIVDNTFSTPYIQRPLDLGADVVVHSATKYLNGHGDVVAGIIVTNNDLATQIRFVGLKDMTGAVIGPQEAYYIIRGLKTFEVRMERHCKNAEKIVEYLKTVDKIEKVYYPGLKEHEGYEVAKKQMKAFGGMISFELKGGYEAGKKLLDNLNLCSLAVSLGDTETLIQHPASMTHSPYTKEERLKAHITDGLVRLSVGLENPEDIIADLEEGFSKI